MIKVYASRIKGFLARRSILVSQSEARAKVHSIGEIQLTDIRDDDDANILNEGVLLFVKQDTPDDDEVKIMYEDGTTNIIKVWKLKASCTEVRKVYATPADVPNDNLYLSK